MAGPAIGRRDAEAADRWRRPHLSAARGISSAVKLLAPSAFLTRNGKERFLGLCSSSGSLVPHMAPAVFLCCSSVPFLRRLVRYISCLGEHPADALNAQACFGFSFSRVLLITLLISTLILDLDSVLSRTSESRSRVLPALRSVYFHL